MDDKTLTTTPKKGRGGRRGGELSKAEVRTAAKNKVDLPRRAIIADILRHETLSYGALYHRMAEEGHKNPKTGLPWSYGLIYKDVKALREEWQQAAALSYSDHVAKQLKEIEHIKVRALALSDFNAALRALQLEMKLLGTEAPVQININLLTTLQFAAIKAGIDPEKLVNSMIIELQENQYETHETEGSE